MTIKIDNMTITTEHPASSYGAGVLLIDGWDKAYGPDDLIPQSIPALMIGKSVPTCAQTVYTAAWRDGDTWSDTVREQVQRWLSQSPNYDASTLDCLIASAAKKRNEKNETHAIW